MSMDGICIRALTQELRGALVGGRISKIYQPETDALVLTIKTREANQQLLLSANASLPLVYITDESFKNPDTPPNFCMLLRKHIIGGHITDISQPDLERIIRIRVSHLNEMGDQTEKTLIVELMGKHSNIIFCDEEEMIIDSIKRIPSHVSSVREVLPGRKYFIPQTQLKASVFSIDSETELKEAVAKPLPLSKAIYSSITGISPVMAHEICHRAGADPDISAAELSEYQLNNIVAVLRQLRSLMNEGSYFPNIIKNGEKPEDYSVFDLEIYSDMEHIPCESVSSMLSAFYSEKNSFTRIRQKTVDLRKITATAIDRCRKKYDLQLRQLKDTEKKDKYRIYGEMLNTYGYGLNGGEKELECENYYSGELIKVPLDPSLSAHENALKYFDRYSKLKRTYEALSTQLPETEAEITHLLSIESSLQTASSDADLAQIKDELVQAGYIKKSASAGKGPSRKKKKASLPKAEPLHFVSSDGIHIYVGKNNYQNDELTFSMASAQDWWFHAKGIPGSHVILKSGGAEVPDSSFNEAGRIAAYYSSGRQDGKVEIDYVQKKEVKKTPGGKPGFVIYHTNYSMVAEADIEGIRQLA